MKKILFILMFAGILQAHAVTEKPVKSTIGKVTVFTQGAQIFRSAPVTLSPGVTRLVFGGLSPQINVASIQAGGKGDFVIHEVKYHIQYPEPPAEGESALSKAVLKEIETLEDSLSELQFRKDEIGETLSDLQLEKDMIVKNKLTKGEGKSDSLEVLKQAMDFFHKKLSELNILIGKTNRVQLQNNKQIALVTVRLNELRTYQNKNEPQKKYEPVHQAIVTVSCNETVSGTVDISYMVTGAGWIPVYDLRAISTTAPVQLTYKANVFQSTGEKWDNVRVKLSTSNPNRSHIKPSLPPWYITYYTAPRPMPYGGAARSQSRDNAATLDKDSEQQMSKKMEELSPAQSAANYSQMVETMANVEFDIKLQYSIPDDGSSHTVSIKSDTLPSIYTHYLVPKMESEAFLLARVTGWENLNLLPGKANLFYEGTYVGETVINPSVINDTMDLALGRDNGITVTRTRMPVKESNKLLGTDITKTIAYELRLKSNKNKPVNLIVEDQVPVSQTRDIRVEAKELSKAELNETTGMLTWNFTLNPKSYKSLKFSYAVTHHKDMPLSMY